MVSETLFDSTTGPRLFVYTNRFNLLEILSSTLLPPRTGFDDERYFADLTELAPGRVPIVVGPSSDVLDHLAAAGPVSFPVAVELDPSRLEPTDTSALSEDGGPIEAAIRAERVCAWAPPGAIALSAAVTVHFRSQHELDEHRARRYDNIGDPLPLQVTPEIFQPAQPEYDAHLIDWLRALPHPPAPEITHGDRISGALILLSQSLPADVDAVAFYSAILNARVAATSRSVHPRSSAPWLSALVITKRRGADLNEHIFAAAFKTLASIDYPRIWRPLEHAEAVRDLVTAATPKADDREQLARHFDAIAGVLRNERDFKPFRPAVGLDAAKALLLVLLRPDPDELLPWPAEETGADAATAATAAAYAGALHGRKRLSINYRPSALDAFLAEQEAAQASSAGSVTPPAESVRTGTKGGMTTIRSRQTKRRLLERTTTIPTDEAGSKGTPAVADEPHGAATETNPPSEPASATKRSDPPPQLILNKDLTARDVPTVHATQLELPTGERDGYGGNPAAWTRIWHFALTFNLEAFERGTGSVLDGADALRRTTSAHNLGSLETLHLRDLRAALVSMYWSRSRGASISAADSALIDGILDAVYLDVSNGKIRPAGDNGPYEPPLGIFGAGYGSGQRRVWFQSRNPSWTRSDLFDRAAGLLLRETDPAAVVSALFLYPPSYSPENPQEPPTHIFMLLLEPRTRSSSGDVVAGEYDRLTQVLRRELGRAEPPPDIDC